MHRQHPDHAGRDDRRRHARRFLQPHRRAARHDPEPRAAAADDGGDGAAFAQRRRRDPRREAEGAALAQALHGREREPRRRARPVPRRQCRRQGGVPASSTKTRCPRATPPRPSSPCAPKCRTGAGPACRSTCAPASVWPSATPRSSSTSGATPHKHLSRRQPGPTSWSSSCSPKTASSCTCWPPRAPASREALAPVSLDLDFDKAFAENRVGAYERLLLDVIAGRLNLFVRSDEQEEAWSWVEPVLDDLAERRRRRRARTRRAPGARRRRARWSRATASPGPKRNSAALRIEAADRFLAGPAGGISTTFSSVSLSLKLPGCFSFAFFSDSFSASRWSRPACAVLSLCMTSPAPRRAAAEAPVETFRARAGEARTAHSCCGKSTGRRGRTHPRHSDHARADRGPGDRMPPRTDRPAAFLDDPRLSPGRCVHARQRRLRRRRRADGDALARDHAARDLLLVAAALRAGGADLRRARRPRRALAPDRTRRSAASSTRWPT